MNRYLVTVHFVAVSNARNVEARTPGEALDMVLRDCRSDPLLVFISAQVKLLKD